MRSNKPYNHRLANNPARTAPIQPLTLEPAPTTGGRACGDSDGVDDGVGLLDDPLAGTVCITVDVRVSRWATDDIEPV